MFGHLPVTLSEPLKMFLVKLHGDFIATWGSLMVNPVPKSPVGHDAFLLWEVVDKTLINPLKNTHICLICMYKSVEWWDWTCGFWLGLPRCDHCNCRQCCHLHGKSAQPRRAFKVFIQILGPESPSTSRHETSILAWDLFTISTVSSWGMGFS